MRICGPTSSYYPTRVELADRHGLDPGKQWIFYPDNYGWAFRPDHAFAKLVALGADHGTIEELRRFHSKSFAIAMTWLQQIAASGDAVVVLRPRPATSEAVFQAHLAAAVGAMRASRVVKAGSVREWILASDIIVSSYSTTLIEAALAGKPAVMLQPTPPSERLVADWHALTAPVETAAALAAALRSPEQAEPARRRLESWARDRLLAEGDPLGRLADFLAELAEPGAPRPPTPPPELIPSPRDLLDRSMDRLYLGWSSLRKGLATKLDPRSAFDTTEADAFGPVDVEERTRAWASVLGDGASRRPAVS